MVHEGDRTSLRRHVLKANQGFWFNIDNLIDLGVGGCHADQLLIELRMYFRHLVKFVLGNTVAILEASEILKEGLVLLKKMVVIGTQVLDETHIFVREF